VAIQMRDATCSLSVTLQRESLFMNVKFILGDFMLIPTSSSAMAERPHEACFVFD